MKTPLSSILLVFGASFVGSIGAVFLKSGAERLHFEVRSLVTNWRLLMGIVTYGVIFLCGFVFTTTTTDFARLPIWIEIAIPLLLNPFSATLSSVCYVMLRQGKENVDVQQIAAVFD